MNGAVVLLFVTTALYHSGSEAANDEEKLKATCNDKQFGLFPHPSDCHQFVQCSYGNPYEMKCATKDLFFNPATKTCDYKRNVKCPGNRCNNRNGGCHQKCVYINDNSYTCACKSGYKPDMNNNQKKCIQGSINMETFCEGHEWSILPDPRGCAGYIQCVGSTSAIMPCPGGLVFNEATNTCDWPYNVKCRGQDFSAWTSWSPCFKPGDDGKCIRERTRTCETGGKLCDGWTSEIKTCRRKQCGKVDACALNKGGCMDQCRNENGKAICSCTDGKVLASDKRSCTTGSCGVAPLRNDNIVAFIINGQSAAKGSYPWQTAIYETTSYGDGEEEENVFKCGGSLIDHKHIVSAAHCFNGLTEEQIKGVTVILGEHDRFKSEGTEGVFQVASITIHKDFVFDILKDDIAIITLSENVAFSDYIAPLCLPSKEETLKPGTNCRVTGWGTMLTDDGREKADILQEITVPVVKESVCKKKNNIIANGRKVTDRMICTGVDDGITTKTACHGDSGGPLACMIDGMWKLYGVVSWGDNVCNVLDAFNVFTKVSKYIDWINEHKQ